MSRFINISECKKSYNFQPDTPWPELLPAYCFENELLCAFERTEGIALSLSEQCLPRTLKALYPDLGLLEVARLSQCLAPDHATQTQFWSLYGYHWKENLRLLVEKLVTLPLEIQRWLQSKKMNPQDLAPLRSLADLSTLEPFWSTLLKSNASKSEASQLLELVVELNLMELPMEDLVKTSPASEWLKDLRALRYPHSTSHDQSADSKIRSMAWPLKSEARWSRRGDRSGIELKLFFSHPQELRRSLDRLHQVCEDLNENALYEDLWSKN